MTNYNWNQENQVLQAQIQSLQKENADLKSEILKMLMAWGTAQDELKTLKERLSSR